MAEGNPLRQESAPQEPIPSEAEGLPEAEHEIDVALLSPEELEALIREREAGGLLYVGGERRSTKEIEDMLKRIAVSKGLRLRDGQSLVSRAEKLRSGDDGDVYEAMNSLLDTFEEGIRTLKEKRNEVKGYLLKGGLTDEEAEHELSIGFDRWKFGKDIKAGDFNTIRGISAKGYADEILKRKGEGSKNGDAHESKPSSEKSEGTHDLQENVEKEAAAEPTELEADAQSGEETPASAESVEGTFEVAYQNWREAREKSDALEKEFNARYREYIQSREAEAGFIRRVGHMAKRAWGIQPDMPPELNALLEKSKAARRDYKQAAGVFAGFSGKKEKKLRAELREANAAGSRGGVENTLKSDRLGRRLEAIESGAVMRRYQRMLNYKLMQSNVQRRLEIQTEEAQKAWRETKLSKLHEKMRKYRWWRIGTMTAGYGALAGVTGGIGAALAAGGTYLGRLGVGIGAGAAGGLGTRAVGEQMYVRGTRKEIQGLKEEATESFFEQGDFDEAERRWEVLLVELNKREARVKTVSAGVALAAGGYAAYEAGDLLSEEEPAGGIAPGEEEIPKDYEIPEKVEVAPGEEAIPGDYRVPEPVEVAPGEETIPHDYRVPTPTEVAPGEEELPSGYQVPESVEAAPGEETIPGDYRMSETAVGEASEAAEPVTETVVPSAEASPETYTVQRGDTLSEIIWGNKGEMDKLPALAELPPGEQQSALYSFLNALDNNPKWQSDIGLEVPPEGTDASDYIVAGQDINMQELNEAFKNFVEEENAESVAVPESTPPPPRPEVVSDEIKSETTDAESRAVADERPHEPKMYPADVRNDIIRSVEGDSAEHFDRLYNRTFSELYSSIDNEVQEGYKTADAEAWEVWKEQVQKMSEAVQPHMNETLYDYIHRYIEETMEISPDGSVSSHTAVEIAGSPEVANGSGSEEAVAEDTIDAPDAVLEESELPRVDQAPENTAAFFEAKGDFIESVQGKPPTIFSFFSDYFDGYSQLKDYTFNDLVFMQSDLENGTTANSEAWEMWGPVIEEMKKAFKPYMTESVDHYVNRFVAEQQKTLVNT